MFLIIVSKHLNCSLGPMSAMLLDQKGPYWPPVSDIFGPEGTLLAPCYWYFWIRREPSGKRGDEQKRAKHVWRRKTFCLKDKQRIRWRNFFWRFWKLFNLRLERETLHTRKKWCTLIKPLHEKQLFLMLQRLKANTNISPYFSNVMIIVL